MAEQTKAAKLTPEQGKRLDALLIGAGIEAGNKLETDEPELVNPETPSQDSDE